MSGPQLPQSCVPSSREYSRLPPGGVCAPDGMRQLYFGVLGPDARSLTYRSGGRVGVNGASGAYQLVEDTSSPSATFSATNRDIKAGERVAFREWALAPGTYSGTVTYTDRASAPYPTYLYGKGPVVGRFRITLHGGVYPCWPRVKCPHRR